MSRATTLPALVLGLWLAMATGEIVQAQTLPDDDAFVRDVIATLNAGDIERRRQLIHPAARPCTEGAAREPLEAAVRRQAAAPIGEDQRSTIRPLNPKQPLMFSDKLDWAVRPTHTLQLSYQVDTRRRRTVILHLVAEGGRWYEVFPCPKPGVLPLRNPGPLAPPPSR